MGNSTTHCIYRIVCFQTGYVYIGQTNDPKKRKRVHFQQLRQSIHINVQLLGDYEKYGKDAFYFEVIERNIPPDKIDEREEFWIAHFDSYRNGYNRTLGGGKYGGKRTPCTWNGVWYESVLECERTLGVSMKWRIAQGYTSDEQLKPPGKRVSCTWNGVAYTSQAECARALGVDPSTLRDFLTRGYTCDTDVSDRIKPCVWNGVKYKSQSEAARVCGISTSVMANRIKKGYTCDNDILKRGGNAKKKPCVWNGRNYPSVTAAAKANGLKITALAYRIKQGYTRDDEVQSKYFHLRKRKP